MSISATPETYTGGREWRETLEERPSAQPADLMSNTRRDLQVLAPPADSIALRASTPLCK